MKKNASRQRWVGITLVLCIMLLVSMLLPGSLIVAHRYGPETQQISYKQMSYLHHLGIDSLFGSLVAFALNGVNILLCIVGLSGKRTARWVFGGGAVVFGITAFLCLTARVYTWISVLPPVLAVSVLFAVDRINPKNG